MYLPLKVEVLSVGEHVVLAIGSSKWTMGYEAALGLSWHMRSHAQSAKRLCGDLSRMYRAVGVLHDAEKGPNAGQPFTPGRLRPVYRDVIKPEQISVTHEGGVVLVRFKNDEARFPYKAALVISQWVRVRAKESKLRAGDTGRHWSKIAVVT